MRNPGHRQRIVTVDTGASLDGRRSALLLPLLRPVPASCGIQQPVRVYPYQGMARASAVSADGSTIIRPPIATSRPSSITSPTRAAPGREQHPRSRRPAHLREPGDLHARSPATGRPTMPKPRTCRAYLLKGGFIIFDDFDGEADWGEPGDADETRVARTPFHPARRNASDLPVVLRSQEPSTFRTRCRQGSNRCSSGYSRTTNRRGAYDGDRQLEQRRRRLLGMVGRKGSTAMLQPTTPIVWASTTWSTR